MSVEPTDEAPLELKHVYDELDIFGPSREALEKSSINSVADLLFKRCELQDEKLAEKATGVKSRGTQEKLLNFVSWFRFFEMTQEEKPKVNIEFKEAVFIAFCKDIKALTETKRRIHIENIELWKDGEALFNLFTTGSEYFDGSTNADEIITTDGEREKLVYYISEEVQCGLSDYLKESSHFKIDDVVGMTIDSLLGASPHTSLDPKPILVYGQTQCGKSALKAVVTAVCSFMQVPLVILTKDVAESKELFHKQVAFALGTSVESNIFTPYGTKKKDIKRHLHRGEGATIIIPDTAAQINKIIELVSDFKQACKGQERRGKFAIVIDECDAMYRTKKNKQKMEQALETLRGMGPSLEIQVSATPAPVLLLFNKEYKQDLKLFSLGTSEDYLGVGDMKPLSDGQGKSVFLDQLSPSGNDNIPFDVEPTYDDIDDKFEQLFDNDVVQDRLCSEVKDGKAKCKAIPSTNEAVMLLYDKALETQEDGAKGILVLDCTLPRVNVHDNVFQKAARIQDLYRSKGKDIIVLVYTGTGVAYRFPGQRHGFSCSNKRFIGDVIEAIDGCPAYGLDYPIFVFGYSKMKRVISFRSSRRFPTHIVVYLGKGHSVENYIQALGRATGNGKSLLEQNGHLHVTYLVPDKDDNLAEFYRCWVQEIIDRVKKGESLAEAMSGRNKLLSDRSNYLRHTNRKTGQRPKRDDIGLYHDRDCFEKPSGELSASRLAIKEKYWNNLLAQRILWILCKDMAYPLSTDDITGYYNDRYGNDSSNQKLQKGEKALTALTHDTLVRKVEVTADKNTWWKVNSDPGWIRKSFLNLELICKDDESVIDIDESLGDEWHVVEDSEVEACAQAVKKCRVVSSDEE